MDDNHDLSGLVAFIFAGILHRVLVLQASFASREGTSKFSALGPEEPSFVPLIPGGVRRSQSDERIDKAAPSSPESNYHGKVGSPGYLSNTSTGDRSVKSDKIVNVKTEKPKSFLEQQADVRGQEIDPKEKNSLKGRPVPGSHIDNVNIFDIESLRNTFESANVENFVGNNFKCEADKRSCAPKAAYGSSVAYNSVLGDHDYVLSDIVRSGTAADANLDPNSKEYIKQHSCVAFVRAGPRTHTHFNPCTVKAAIVTCGGLCPGLNNVIRELTHALFYLYNADRVIGIRGGYHGFNEKSGFESIELTPALVESCHHQGGTILASSRGGFDEEIIIKYLIDNGIQQLYVIGGDGTHRGANKVARTCIERKLNIAVVGIPKTIDNDVDLIDRSFGFSTAVESAQAAIVSAKTEAMCNVPNGIGIVKLMGRSAGFIAVHATLASGDVDLCLVPEKVIELEGENGCLPYLMRRVKERGHAVVVVAEGAGEELLGKSALTDASGNKVLPAIGEFLKSKIGAYFSKQNMEATVKYIDPSYMIRSIPANASDALYCMLLAQNAVHGAMAGFTAFSVGLVNNRVVYIPISKLVATSPRVMDPVGRTWERVLTCTRQPDTRSTDLAGTKEGLLLI